TTDITELMTEVLAKAKEALANTPELLPVLKQVGVVDSGGQGLVYIYEGFHQHLTSGNTAATAPVQGQASVPAPVKAAVLTKHDNALSSVQSSAQSQLSTEDIEFLYDMEFFINRQLGASVKSDFDEEVFRKALSVNGDSIIVISDDETIKVHVHSKTPGEVLNLALLHGEITQIHILNMREQHRDLLTAGMDIAPMPDVFADIPEEKASVQSPAVPPADDLAPYGFIAVSSGDGISDIFRSLGVDAILAGGQTMNPSTEDFVNAISSISAKHVYILPNNSNIVLAAQQAKDLLEGERDITVIPSKSIPQGISAAFAFQEEEAVDANTSNMLEAIAQVKSGQVTNAVRDTVIEELEIKSGQYIGISNSKIVAAADELLNVSKQLLTSMLENGDEIVTVLTGAETEADVTESLGSWLEETYPQVEVEVHEGGQPLYYYLFSVEP
ncbi:hypothetical protein KC345_g11371, partial [Hortaea werneckii]